MEHGVIGRRAVLLAGAGITARRATAALPVPPADALRFRLIRHDSEIGRHIVTFETRDDTLTVRVAVDSRVTLLSVPIVHYRHRVVETWQGETLTSLTSETDKNGRLGWMNARRTAEGLVVLGSQTDRYIAPDSAIGTTYWNKRMLDGPMISLEDGVLLHPKVTRGAADLIPLASGTSVVADHYRLSGSFNVDIWYDHADTWAGLALTVADGSRIHYERL